MAPAVHPRVFMATILKPSESTPVGPLLLKLGQSAKFLGVSRTTLWRMIEKKLLEKVEILPRSYRLRRADLEAIADKKAFSQ